MTKLAIFCDGTWNGVRMTHLTNVARLARSVAVHGVGLDGLPVRQVVFYDEGVGVKSGVSRVNDEIESIMGGAFGRGLDHRIEAAYRFITMNYNPSQDELYIFGFSRGAYTARSLCGLIRKCGILKREHLREIPNAMKLYRDRESHPAGPECVAFRKAFAYEQATGLEGLSETELRKSEQARDKAANLLAVDRSSIEMAIPESARKDSVQIRYLGVWDTVGSLGVPNRFWFLRGFNKKYAFHDPKASRLIQSLRHAAAIDEDRAVFDITAVSNIHDLNIAAAAAMQPPKQVRSPNEPQFLPPEDRPYQQQWFPGDHGAVGGGNIEPGLSSAALLWVKEGAERAGLTFEAADGGEISEAARLQNPLAEFRIRANGAPKNPLAVDFLGLAGGYKPRYCPLTLEELHESARTRLAQSSVYRPPLLKRFSGTTLRAPHRMLAAVLSPMTKLAIIAALVAVAAALLFLVWSVGKGVEYMTAHPKETAEEFMKLLKFLLPLWP